jgi:puromycin-sensitive aminopeptidase
MSESLDPYRLPRTVLPTRYELMLEPDLPAAQFSGRVVIAVEVVEPVQVVWLNAADLAITTAALEDAAGQQRPVAAVTLHEAQERVQLDLGAVVPPGAYRVHLAFVGTLNDKLHGFYRSTFRDAQGTTHVIATTQFETTDARRAFPCFDEPDFKAVFGVTLVVPQTQYALSNAPIVAEHLTPAGRRRIVFADTMKMSTYLVAFVVGPFAATAPVEVEGVPLRVVYPLGKAHLTAYALEAGAFALRYFTEYYGLPYPGQKLDLVAIPDFAFGAMENLGCVTFREVLLLVDPQQATQPELMRIADVIAHEIAHMWFGDLVTMKWWNGIWLNEAFATFMATLASDAFHPAWQRWTQFSLARSAALDVDALHTTRPIEYPVQSPQDANGMFDLLTYQKGAAVLRMLEQYLGADAFRAGIRQYLTRYQYANTETNDLWDALEAVTHAPARRVMDAWIFQRGYPLVSVDHTAPGRLTLHQQRFHLTPGDEGEATRWPMPVGLRYSANGQVHERRELLDAASVTLELDPALDWLVVNAGGHGFYRVRYAATLLHRLLPIMMHQLAPIERYGLVDDTWAAVVAGTTPASAFFAFAREFGEETDLDVWTVLVRCLDHLERLLDGEARRRYQERLRQLYRPALDRLGWEPGADDTSRTLELRGLLLRALAVTARDEDAIAYSRTVHARALHDSTQVEPNLAAAAAGAVATVGTSDEYAVFLARVQQAATPQEERRYQMLLAAFPEERELARTLAMCLDGTIRTQDAPYLVAQCLRHRDHGRLAWRFVRDHWEQMLHAYPDNAIVRMLEGITMLADPEVATEIDIFFAQHPVPQGALTLQQHLEKLRVNVALHAREAETFARGLHRG